MPKLIPMTPTRVRSPRMPDTEYFAPCMKSMPASIRTVPGGMMSTSSVNRGRCCAPAISAKHVSKIRIITMRVICARDSKTGLQDSQDPVFFCAKGNQFMPRFAVLFLALVCFAGHTAAQQNSIQIQGIKARVTIHRDERGIPYVEAQNDEDLYFGQGYATAQDRLWQMDLFRRTARGELAEVLGAGPNNIALDQDKLHRTYGFAQVAEAEFANASPRARVMLEAYARGVNAYAASLDPKAMPPEFQILQYSFRPWTPSDSLVVVKIFFEALSDTWRLDLMRQALSVLPAEKRAELLPEISPIDVLVVGKDTQSRAKTARTKPEPLSPATLANLAHNQSIAAAALDRIGFHTDALAASNNWVVSGKRTVTGKPLLSNDPHLRPTAPSIWHMVHLSTPAVRVAGVVMPGLPGVIIGHNDRIAWGFTNVGPDVQDLYIEKFNPENPKQYQTPGGWQDAVIRSEQIKVRKGIGSSEYEVVNYDV